MTAPARFWPRYAAWSLDAALILLAGAPFVAGRVAQAAPAFRSDLLQLLVVCYEWLDRAVQQGLPPLAATPELLADPRVREAAAALLADSWAMSWPVLAAYLLVGLAYHVVAESTRWRASPGKRMLGLVVADGGGRPLRPGRALARHLAGALSWLSLNLGHMTAMLPHRLALHDRVSATRVLEPAPERPLPAWAKAWLALQVMAAAVAGLALAHAFARLAWQALETALG